MHVIPHIESILSLWLMTSKWMYLVYFILCFIFKVTR